MPDRKKRERGDDPRASEPRRRSGMRRLVIRGETWHWRFGNHVSIRDPDDGSHGVALIEMLGRSWDDLERASWKRSLSVDPSEVVDHIDRKVLGYTDAGGFPAGSRWRGHQADIREGWVAFEGPRGMWQARPGVWITDIRSPEDVKTQARTYEILGMDIGEWTGMKVAHMAEMGTSLDQLRIDERSKPEHRRVDPVRLLMEYPAPTIPVPTAAQLARYAALRIAVEGDCRRAA